MNEKKALEIIAMLDEANDLLDQIVKKGPSSEVYDEFQGLWRIVREEIPVTSTAIAMDVKDMDRWYKSGPPSHGEWLGFAVTLKWNIRKLASSVADGLGWEHGLLLRIEPEAGQLPWSRKWSRHEQEDARDLFVLVDDATRSPMPKDLRRDTLEILHKFEPPDDGEDPLFTVDGDEEEEKRAKSLLESRLNKLLVAALEEQVRKRRVPWSPELGQYWLERVVDNLKPRVMLAINGNKEAQDEVVRWEIRRLNEDVVEWEIRRLHEELVKKWVRP